MKNLFNLENPIFQFLNQVFDLLMVNFLCIVCSLPIVTAGAAIAAMNKVTQDMVLEEDKGVFKRFFRAFRDNFKQATLVWLVLLVAFIAMVCNGLIVYVFFSASTWLYVALAIPSFVILSMGCYLLHLIPRYEGSVKEHAKNSMILTVVKLPRSIALVALAVAPVLVLYISRQAFLQTLVFWIIIGIAFLSFVQANVLKEVFRQLEKGQNSVSVGM